MSIQFGVQVGDGLVNRSALPSTPVVTRAFLDKLRLAPHVRQFLGSPRFSVSQLQQHDEDGELYRLWGGGVL